MVRRLTPTAALLLLTLAAPAHAWWANVHRQVCAAAFELTSDAGRSLVQRLGAAADDADAWPQSCTWADEVRRTTHRDTYGYHFVNVTRGEQRTDVSVPRDCAAYDCVQQAIRRYATYLAAPTTRGRERREALRFVGHFVADAHQPLHVGWAEDLGGNLIEVRVPGAAEPRLRLHAVWDGIVPRRAGLTGVTDIVAAARRLDPALTQTLDFVGVVQDSFDLARQQAYRTPDGQPVRSGMTLDDAYFDAAAPVARRQIALAAARLAHLLDVIGRGDFDPLLMN